LFEVNAAIKENRSLYWAAIIQVVYGIIELTDSIAIVLISAGLIPNFYVSFISIDTEIGILLETMPAAFIAIFIFFTIFRLLSGYWILQNKVVGIWTAIFVTSITLVAVWFFLPFSILDLAFIGPLIILLFKGYFGDAPILQEHEESD